MDATILEILGTAVVSAILGAVGYAKIAVGNVSSDEAERIALDIVTALGDGVMTAKEKTEIITEIIKCMKSK